MSGARFRFERLAATTAVATIGRVQRPSRDQFALVRENVTMMKNQQESTASVCGRLDQELKACLERGNRLKNVEFKVKANALKLKTILETQHGTCKTDRGQFQKASELFAKMAALTREVSAHCALLDSLQDPVDRLASWALQQTECCNLALVAQGEKRVFTETAVASFRERAAAAASDLANAEADFRKANEELDKSKRLLETSRVQALREELVATQKAAEELATTIPSLEEKADKARARVKIKRGSSELMREKLDRLRSTVMELCARAEEMKSTIGSIEAMRRDLETTQVASKSCTARILVTSQDEEHFRADINKVQEEIRRLTSATADLKAQHVALQGQVEECKSPAQLTMLEEIQTNQKHLTNTLHKIKREHAMIQLQVKHRQRRRGDWDKLVASGRKRIATAVSACECVTREQTTRIAVLQSELKDSRVVIKNGRNLIGEMDKDCARTRADARELEEALGETLSELRPNASVNWQQWAKQLKLSLIVSRKETATLLRKAQSLERARAKSSAQLSKLRASGTLSDTGALQQKLEADFERQMNIRRGDHKRELVGLATIIARKEARLKQLRTKNKEPLVALAVQTKTSFKMPARAKETRRNVQVHTPQKPSRRSLRLAAKKLATRVDAKGPKCAPSRSASAEPLLSGNDSSLIEGDGNNAAQCVEPAHPTITACAGRRYRRSTRRRRAGARSLCAVQPNDKKFRAAPHKLTQARGDASWFEEVDPFAFDEE